MESSRAYRDKHREELRAKGREYVRTHKKERAAYYVENKNSITAYQKKYRADHREKNKGYMKVWLENNKDRKREMDRKYHAAHVEIIRKRVKEWSNRNPHRAMDNWLKSKYGITLAQYNAMIESQKGVCKICGGKGEIKRRLHVDHCHSTGKVGGLLCYYCNLMLGLARDNPETLKNAARYLKNFGEAKKVNKIKTGGFDAPL